MKHRGHLLNRRIFTSVGLGAVAAIASGATYASASTVFGVLDTPAIPVRTPTGVSFQAVTLVGSRLVAVGEHGVIIYSDDYARTWTQASVPVDVQLNSVSFATAEIGWAAGSFGVILNTMDGGKTWQTQLNGIQAATLTLQAAKLAVAQNLNSPGVPLAEKRAEIFISDGPDLPFMSVLTLSSEKIIVFGAYRLTMITTDGGKTWSDWSLHIDDRLSHTLYDAALIGSDIYVVGEQGLIFCSTDGGKNFPQITSPTSTTLFGIFSAKDGSLIVYGVAGSAFRSADSGKTWVAINIKAPDDLLCGVVLDSGVIIIASEADLLYISENNGVSFSLIPNASPGSVFDMIEIPNEELVLAGAAGIKLMSAKNLQA